MQTFSLFQGHSITVTALVHAEASFSDVEE
jgi:hypothetical protein